MTENFNFGHNYKLKMVKAKRAKEVSLTQVSKKKKIFKEKLVKKIETLYKEYSNLFVLELTNLTNEG